MKTYFSSSSDTRSRFRLEKNKTATKSHLQPRELGVSNCDMESERPGGRPVSALRPRRSSCRPPAPRPRALPFLPSSPDPHASSCAVCRSQA